MLDFTALHAGVEYRRDQFLDEAAHDRLVRPLRPTRAPAPAARPTRRGRLGSLVIARTVLFLVIGAAGLSPFLTWPPA
jgi:anti-sigma factor RsiW